MKLLKCDLPVSHNIFLFGDLHIGTVLCHRDGIQQLIEMMQSSYHSCTNNYGVCVGDMIEAIMVDDKRYDIETTAEPFPLQQVKDAVKTLSPIASKLLCILKGNHEQKLWKFGDLAKEIADQLNVPYGTWTAKLTINNREKKNSKYLYKIFATHGRKSITSTADDPKRRLVNQRLILKRHLKFKAADCVVQVKGHTHKLIVCAPEEELYLIDDGKKVKQKYISSSQNAPYIHPDHRYYINSGSFYKLYGKDGISSYAEIAEYDPLELGFCILMVRDGKIQGVERIVL